MIATSRCPANRVREGMAKWSVLTLLIAYNREKAAGHYLPKRGWWRRRRNKPH